MALAFGINLALARIGTAGVLWVSPMFDYWQAAVWLGAAITVFGFVAFLFYNIFDHRLDRDRRDVRLAQGANAAPEEEFRLADLFVLLKNRSFLFITALCVLFYSAVFPFLAYAPDMLVNKFGMSDDLSSQIASIIPFGTILFTPLFGLFVDMKGKSASMMIYGSMLLILVHLWLSLTNLPPYVPIFVLGVAFSLVPAAMWPSVAKIVDPKTTGTAYGVMTTIQNFGLMIFPWLIGVVLDRTNPGVTAELVEQGKASYDYTLAVLMMVGLGMMGIVFAFLLRRDDRIMGYGLERPTVSK